MKICIVNQPWNPAIPPVESGSIAIWTYEVARRLAGKCQVLVYSKSVPGEPEQREVDGVLYMRCSDEPDPYRMVSRVQNLIDTIRGNHLPHFAKNSYYAGYFRRVAEMIQTDKPDVVHLHNFGQAASTIRAAKPDVHIVLHMHCEWLTQLPKTIVSEWLAHVDSVIGCSDHIVGKICAAFPELSGRCHRVYNGINTDLFKPDGESIFLGEKGQRVILFVGRLTPEKGLHVLIRAFEEVVSCDESARLVIVGSDAYTPKQFLVDLSDDPQIRDLAKFYRGDYVSMLKSSITESVRPLINFYGFVPNHQLPEIYRAAYLLANPSFSDAFPLTLPEAMACGLPVVATNVGGMPEAVGGYDCGLTCAAGDEGELVRCFLEILRDRELRAEMSQNAPKRAASLFSWSKIAEDAFAVYRTKLN